MFNTDLKLQKMNFYCELKCYASDFTVSNDVKDVADIITMPSMSILVSYSFDKQVKLMQI